jgi:hypothetical protein
MNKIESEIKTLDMWINSIKFCIFYGGIQSSDVQLLLNKRIELKKERYILEQRLMRLKKLE